MRLPQPFYRLPMCFDVERIGAEVSALPGAAWAKHPNEIAGNSSLRLISVEGGENDDVNGVMRATPHLLASPYLRQVLASFGVVWSRSRLMRLAPGATVPQHADINHHWFNRVRLHIPVITRPEVRFYCGDEMVHMAAGEAWLFDNWRLHRVENASDHERIHLVADTSGSAAFWQFVMRSATTGPGAELLTFEPGRDAMPLMERLAAPTVMHPSECDLLIMDLRAELVATDATSEASARLLQYHTVLNGYTRDWRQLYLLHGAQPSGWAEFAKLRDSLRTTSQSLAGGIVAKTNKVAAHQVLEGRILRPSLTLPRVRRPVFIVAAPRTGSTLLFETLAASERILTLGGEAHWLVEGLAALQPGPNGVESNRLDTAHASPPVAAHVRDQISSHWRDSAGRPAAEQDDKRFLEKTPKNALRIPFFAQIFPDAEFIFLWRDPRENLSSIMDAWDSGRWRTYNGLAGFEGPWSLILPPGWAKMNGKPLEAIAAFQWESTNRTVLDDLAEVPRDRWMALEYAELVRDPSACIARVCQFLQLEPDTALQARVSAPLPLSRYTHTPPNADKWRKNEARIESVMPLLEQTWQRLRALGKAS